MDFYTDKELSFLSRFGRTQDGQDLMAVLHHAKTHLSSLGTIESKLAPDVLAAEVAGRNLFIKFIDSLNERMKSQPRGRNPLNPLKPEDYE